MWKLTVELIALQGQPLKQVTGQSNEGKAEVESGVGTHPMKQRDRSSTFLIPLGDERCCLTRGRGILHGPSTYSRSRPQR